MQELYTAIVLEAAFAKWSDHMYDLFRLGGDINGTGMTPREFFMVTELGIVPIEIEVILMGPDGPEGVMRTVH